MKTLLLFPPQGDPFQPYSSLPALAAYLRANGREVSLRDLNIECHHYFASPGRLARACVAVRQALEELETRPELTYSEQERYLALAKASLYGPMAVERIDWAKGVLRSRDDFYEMGKYTSALDVFQKALALISAEYHPAKLTHLSFDCGYSPDSVLDILAATRDKRQNPFMEFYEEVVIPELADDPPDVVGISITYRNQIIAGFTLARAIKAALPGVRVVVGGSVISSVAEKLLHCPGLFALVDYFIVYEGEHALAELLDCLEGSGDLSQVPNLVYVDGGRIRRSEPFVIEPLNDLPTPDYDGLPLDMYLSPDLVILLPISRGCYWRKCAFCTVSGATNKRYRQRRVDLVVQDITTLKEKYRTPYFFFSVDVMPPKALRNLSLALVEAEAECYWQSEVRLDPAFDQDLCKLMAEAGCRNLMFGMESANQRVLDLMAKGTRAEDFPEILRNCKGAGIATTLFCITGFPSETVEEAEDTLNFILRNRDSITSAAFSTFQLNEGSPVQHDPERFCIVRVHKTEKDLRKDYRYEVSSGQSMVEAQRTRQIIEETLDGVFPLRRYLTGLHPHVLIHLAHFDDPDFVSNVTPAGKASACEAAGPASSLSRSSSLESRLFAFDWRNLENTLDVASTQVEYLVLEDGLTPAQAHAVVGRRTRPVKRGEVRVVYNPETDRYHFISSGAWKLLSAFNGGRRVQELLDGKPAEVQERLLGFIRRMHGAGLLRETSKQMRQSAQAGE